MGKIAVGAGFIHVYNILIALFMDEMVDDNRE